MFYRWTRDLHLYFGLFVSPFVLLFAVSVLFLNHAKVSTDRFDTIETVRDISVPLDIRSVRGPDAVARAKMFMQQLNVDGEVGFTRYIKQSDRFMFPLSRPGLEMTIDVDLQARSATVSRRVTSFWEALGYLHKMPGPHNVAIRGNWFWTRAWRLFADATVYLLLFITMSGVYLWYAIRGERKVGFALLTAGAISFVGLIYVVIR